MVETVVAAFAAVVVVVFAVEAVAVASSVAVADPYPPGLF